MPYSSKAQAGKFHEMEKRGEISHKVVAEFDHASKGMKLPEKVHHKEEGRKMKHIHHGGK